MASVDANKAGGTHNVLAQEFRIWLSRYGWVRLDRLGSVGSVEMTWCGWPTGRSAEYVQSKRGAYRVGRRLHMCAELSACNFGLVYISNRVPLSAFQPQPGQEKHVALEMCCDDA